jgi:hypothetical protein
MKPKEPYGAPASAFTSCHGRVVGMRAARIFQVVPVSGSSPCNQTIARVIAAEPGAIAARLRASVGEQLHHALDPRTERLPAGQIGEVAEADDHEILRRHDHHELTLVALRGE